jgi:Fe-S-cluster containining protein
MLPTAYVLINKTPPPCEINHPVSGSINNDSRAATRLCEECGMCCDGVLFFGAKLQPADPVRALRALGLKIKRRHGELFCLQPCAAHIGSACSIYESRPGRCRDFECRQLLSFALQEISEETAMRNIQRARALVDRVEALLALAKDERIGKSLAARCETIFNPPLDDFPDAEQIRGELRAAWEELEAFLSSHFRMEPEPVERAV